MKKRRNNQRKNRARKLPRNKNGITMQGERPPRAKVFPGERVKDG